MNSYAVAQTNLSERKILRVVNRCNRLLKGQGQRQIDARSIVSRRATAQWVMRSPFGTGQVARPIRELHRSFDMVRIIEATRL